MEDDRFSTQIHGDLEYAGSRETATSTTPAMVAEERERLEQDCVKAHEALMAARARGNAAAIERAEARYDAAMERYVAAQTEMAGATAAVAPDAATEGGTRSLRDLFDDSDEERLAIKLEAWRELLDFICGGKRLKMWVMFQNFVAFCRRVDPERVSKISQKTWAWLFGETRAATSAREKRVVEEPAVRELGIRGYHLLGGTKTEEARRKYSQAQMGNHNRRKAKGGKKG